MTNFKEIEAKAKEKLDRDLAREMPINRREENFCRECGKDKETGLLMCWSCWKNELKSNLI